MVQIIPAILSIKEADFKRDIIRYQESELFREGWIHIDFMDGLFVPNKSIDPDVVLKYPIHLAKEAHLMVSHPLKWIGRLGGFERIIFHIESEDDPEACIKAIRDNNLEVGMALKYETPIDRLLPFVEKIDLVLVMSIVPGFQGQQFIHESFDKIKQIKAKDWHVKIGVDGSVNSENVKELFGAGADNLVIGSYLLKGDVDENLENIWEKLKS